MPKHVFRNPTPSASKKGALCPLFTGGLGSVNGPALRLRSGRPSLEMVHWTISLAFGQPLLTQQNCRQAILGVSKASDLERSERRKTCPSMFFAIPPCPSPNLHRNPPQLP